MKRVSESTQKGERANIGVCVTKSHSFGQGYEAPEKKTYQSRNLAWRYSRRWHRGWLCNSLPRAVRMLRVALPSVFWVMHIGLSFR